MAVANALGQRGSKCVTAAPWKLPTMAWSTVCDDYFRVADSPLAGFTSGSCQGKNDTHDAPNRVARQCGIMRANMDFQEVPP
jgi:hypothetical protein